MGLTSFLLGDTNPVSKYVTDNKNTIRGAFAGFGQGRNFSEGLGRAALGANQGAQSDDAYAITQAAEAKRQEQLMQAVENMRQYNPQIASIVESGGMDPQTAWNTILQGMGGAEPTDDMREFEYAQKNPEFSQFLNPSPEAPKPPAMVQEYEYAKQQGYSGSLIDYQRDTSARSMQGMDPTTKKELFEAQEAATAGDYVLSALDRALELNSTAVDGPYAGQRAYAGAAIPDVGIGNANEQDYATLEFQNITTELALTQLKTIFGGMPTEGERKILIELQGSVDKPRAVRQNILERAKQMAQRRIDDANAKAEALRSGGYFQPGYGQQPAAAPGGTTSTGVPWSIE